MSGDIFEKAVSDFLDSDNCEAVNEAFFQAMKTAFSAGWAAAEKHYSESKIVYIANSSEYDKVRK